MNLTDINADGKQVNADVSEAFESVDADARNSRWQY